MRQNNFKQAKSYWGAMLATNFGMIASLAEAVGYVIEQFRIDSA